VRSNSIKLGILLTIFALITLAVILKNGGLKIVKNQIKPDVAFFFMISGLIVIVVSLFAISKKWPIVTELVCIFYGVFTFAACLPTWIEDRNHSILIAGETLLQVNTLVYVFNGMLLCFFTSQYTISLAGRSLMYVNNINMAFRRWSSDSAELLPVLFNVVLIATIFECHSYIMNEEKVKLFLAKDFSEKQEQQTRAILQNIPTNVMVVSDSKLKFKNKHADKLLDDFSKGINSARDDSLDPNFDHSDFMLKAQIFRPELKKLSENAPQTLQT
jgi:hypothetical protein